MRQARFRQLARLEKLAQPHIQRVRGAGKEWLRILNGAVSHAAVLAFIIRYGRPTIGEPLPVARERVRETQAWKRCGERFPRLLRNGERKLCCEPDSEGRMTPFSKDPVLLMGHPLRHAIIDAFPGVTEKEKLDAAFAAAPPWLIWFTGADYTAKLLGLTVPDLSDVSQFARSTLDVWYGFPNGVFEPQPWPHGPKNKRLVCTDLRLLVPSRLAPYMTPRPVRRPEEWPMLIPATVLEEFPKPWEP